MGESSTSQVAYRFQRVHPAFITGPALAVKVKRAEPVHPFFQQSSLDSACGLHVAATVIGTLGLAKSSALENMSRRKHGISAALWKTMGDTYFSGIHAPDWAERFESLDLPVNLTAKYRSGENVDSYLVEWLMQGSLVALVLNSVRHGRTKHWSLGVGIEGAFVNKRHLPDTILTLDPSTDAPVFAVSNARLRLRGKKSIEAKDTRPGGRGRSLRSSTTWDYESLAWQAEEVVVEAAIRIRPHRA